MKKFLSFGFVALLIFSLTACNDEKEVVKEESKTIKKTEISNSGEVLSAIKVGMTVPDEYQKAKKKINAPAEDQISIGDGNIGSVLKVKDGFVVVSITADDDVHEVKNARVSEVRAFKTMDEVEEYEAGLLEEI